MCRLLLLGLLGVVSVQVAGQDVVIENGWIRESPPGVQVNAAYMDIHNGGADEVELLAVRSPDFAAVEIHKTIVEDGKAGMRRYPALAIPAGAVLSLAPGSWHLMLLRPGRAIREGGLVELSLEFADGGRRTLSLPVRRGR